MSESMRAPCGIQEWLGGALLLTKRSHFAAWEQGNSSLDSFDDPLNLVRSIKRLSWIGSYISGQTLSGSISSTGLPSLGALGSSLDFNDFPSFLLPRLLKRNDSTALDKAGVTTGC